MKLRTKVYISKYDVQGDTVEIPKDALVSKKKWEKFKQKIINDFIDNFSYHFKNKYKYEFKKFGKGRYKDNAYNRRLGRVGKPYDKGREFRATITEMLRKKEVQIYSESRIIKNIKIRRWTEKDDEMLIKLTKKGISAKAIAERLFRTIRAIYNKRYRLRKKGKL